MYITVLPSSDGWYAIVRGIFPDVYFNSTYKRLLKKLSERQEIKEVAGRR